MKNYLFLFLISLSSLNLHAQKTKLPLDKWHYIQGDSSRAMWGNYDKPDWLRYYGLDFLDVNRDGYKDIVSGRYFYLNPAKNMESEWKRTDLGINADGCILTDIDGDAAADIIAMAYPNVYWLEAQDKNGTLWSNRKIGEIPKTDHVNGQGFRHIRLKKGEKETILLTGEGGVYAATIPNEPNRDWQFKKIISSFSDEGIGYGDIDGDGDLDIVFGDSPQKGKFPTILSWFENPNSLDTEWKKYPIGITVNSIDRIELADFDGDGKLDIAVVEELYPGLEPLAHLYTFKNSGKPKEDNWVKSIHFTGFSNNNLDVADLDKDGDIDIVTGEHKGKTYPTLIFENNGKGIFTQRILDTGKESHLGTQLVDLDNDGDLDMVSAAWDNHKFLHIWRNDAVVKKPTNLKKNKSIIQAKNSSKY
jgi:hypothetical protein